MKKILLFFLPVLGFAQAPQPGTYRAVITMQGQQLPFGLDIQPGRDARTFAVYALNGKERLPMDPATLDGDSLRIPMGLFDAELVGKVSGRELVGVYRRQRANGVAQVPFRATMGQPWRFTPAETETKWRVAGTYATTFGNPGDENQAVGVFDQTKNRVTGSFLTPTGDYRFLDGNIVGDSLLLSTYDGSHLFLFKAKLTENGFGGLFYSGIGSARSPFTARRDPNAALPDEKTLTFLKPGADRFTFRFPDAVTGQPVSLDDPRFRGKVTVVQIMGSWCPNCMDETNFLVPWYRKNSQRGVEIVGLSYERSPDFAVSAPKVVRMKERFNIPYPVLLAGVSDKTASATLPQLNRIMGYPTTIFVDKKGTVREIHTGFSGPGTGAYYDKFVDDFNRLMDKLLAE